VLASGESAANGYVALSELDADGDGWISSTDAGFADLRVWIDGNSDGTSQTDELRSLESLGIARLDLAAQTTVEKDNGNLVGLISGYETTDGATHEMADVWFVADKNEFATTATDPLLAGTEAAGDLGTKVSGLVQAIASFEGVSDTTAGASSLGLPEPTTSAAPLVATTGGMVDVLKQFDANGQPLAGSSLVQSAPAAPSLTPQTLENIVGSGILASGK
jgi:hypothetical protein